MKQIKKLYVILIISFIFNVILYILLWNSYERSDTEDKHSEYDEILKRYLVFDTKCKIPDYEELRTNTLYPTLDYIPCSDLNLMTKIIPDYEELRTNSLYPTLDYMPCSDLNLMTKIIKTKTKIFLVVEVYKTETRSINCCYCNVSRDMSGKPYFEIAVTACKFFESVVEVNHDVLYVKCYDNKTLIYENVHVILENTQMSHEFYRNATSHKPPSVLIIGLSAVSRINFRRMFPKTNRILKFNKWIDYKVYNRIGESTQINLMSLLTGKFNVTLNSADNYSFLWDDFKKMNYITAYGEDTMYADDCRTSKHGFYRQPTDFYFRHYFIASHMLRKKYLGGSIYCTGPETTVERILNVAKDFSIALKNISTFGLFWINSFDTNNPTILRMLDEKIEEFFQELYNFKILHDTVIVFLGDKGSYKLEEKTLEAWYGDQMPFLYFWVPQRFKTEHWKAYNYLWKNRNSLVTPFDLYLTFQTFLRLYNTSYNIRESKDCLRCKSLFEDNMPSRSCDEIPIDIDWCSCLGYRRLKAENKLVKRTTEFLIANMKTKLSPKLKNLITCRTITLKNVIYAWISESTSNWSDVDRYLQIGVSIYPGIIVQAKFKVTYMKGVPYFVIFGELEGFDKWTDFCEHDKSFALAYLRSWFY